MVPDGMAAAGAEIDKRPVRGGFGGAVAPSRVIFGKGIDGVLALGWCDEPAVPYAACTVAGCAVDALAESMGPAHLRSDALVESVRQPGCAVADRRG
jgi:hypothetical protein